MLKILQLQLFPTQPTVCQNHTVVVQSTELTLWQTATVIFGLISVVLVTVLFWVHRPIRPKFFADRSNKHPQS